MAKKYLSLDEAADFAGLSAQELIRLREAGEIRGFADRGTWKFKADDLEELKRSRQADSSPDVPIFTEDEPQPAGRGGRDDRPEHAEHAILDADDEDDEAATIVRGIHDEDDEEDQPRSSLKDTSDSDVRLILDDTLRPIDSGVLSADDSDSDVQLVDSSPTLLKSESDDDVDLMTSDSDVRLVAPESDVQLLDSGSDSDVRLAPDDDKEGTDSDVRLVNADSDSDVTIVPEDSAATGADEGTAADLPVGSVFDEEETGLATGEGSSIQLVSESGIALESLETRIGGAPGSEIRLESDDTGVTLEDESGIARSEDAAGGAAGAEAAGAEEDSGITLDFGDDSGLALESLEDDSGIALGGDDDSGLSLDLDDSGIALESLDDSGIALESLEESGIGLEPGREGTVPMMDVEGHDLDRHDTAMEMPAVDGESEYELATSAHDSGHVLAFDEGDEFDEHEATVVRKGADVSDEFDMTGGDAFDEFGDEEFATAEAGYEEDEEEGFDAFDEDAGFESEFEEGESEADFAPAGVMRGGQVAAPVEADWGTGPFVGLTFATLLMVVCGLMMYDLVRSMWSWQDPSGFNSALLDIVKGFM